MFDAHHTGIAILSHGVEAQVCRDGGFAGSRGANEHDEAVFVQGTLRAAIRVRRHEGPERVRQVFEQRFCLAHQRE